MWPGCSLFLGTLQGGQASGVGARGKRWGDVRGKRWGVRGAGPRGPGVKGRTRVDQGKGSYLCPGMRVAPSRWTTVGAYVKAVPLFGGWQCDLLWLADDVASVVIRAGRQWRHGHTLSGGGKQKNKKKQRACLLIIEKDVAWRELVGTRTVRGSVYVCASKGNHTACMHVCAV